MSVILHGGASVSATHMSNGYTTAFAITAPVAPAMAEPQGGSVSFDCAAIVLYLSLAGLAVCYRRLEGRGSISGGYDVLSA